MNLEGMFVVSYVSATSYNCEKKHYSCLLVISRLAVNLKGAFLIKTRTETWCAAVNSLSKCQEAAGVHCFHNYCKFFYC